MLIIKGIMWGERKVGLALHKLHSGENEFIIDVKGYSGVYRVNKEDAINRYGISVINRGNLKGIWIPLDDLERKESKVQIK